MIRARAIARSLGLEMKMGDVEYQGDKRKATFYYTADGRVDFRELIRHYAKEFKVKIEMRQIGARQESSRIGGLGSCGRELCCSTWLTNFKSVTTGAARYQNLAINQSKLSGQCGRLKCCLNYELDSYLDALQDFPQHHERLHTEAGTAVLIKTDIFKRQMVYTYEAPAKRGSFFTIPVERVKEVLAMNRAGEKPMELVDSSLKFQDEEVTLDFEDVTGAVELPMEKRHRRGKRRKNFKRSDRRDDRRGGRRDRNESTDRRPSRSKRQSDNNNESERPKKDGRDKTDKPSNGRGKSKYKGKSDRNRTSRNTKDGPPAKKDSRGGRDRPDRRNDKK